MALPLQIEPIEYRRTWDNAHAPVKLHLIVGGQAQGHRRLNHSIYLRRRVAALVLLVVESLITDRRRVKAGAA